VVIDGPKPNFIAEVGTICELGHRPAVFVPESDHVTELVHDNSVGGAMIAEGHFLPRAALPSDVRTAPTHNTQVNNTASENDGPLATVKLIKIHKCSLDRIPLKALLHLVLECSRNGENSVLFYILNAAQRWSILIQQCVLRSLLVRSVCFRSCVLSLPHEKYDLCCSSVKVNGSDLAASFD